MENLCFSLIQLQLAYYFLNLNSDTSPSVGSQRKVSTSLSILKCDFNLEGEKLEDIVVKMLATIQKMFS